LFSDKKKQPVYLKKYGIVSMELKGKLFRLSYRNPIEFLSCHHRAKSAFLYFVKKLKDAITTEDGGVGNRCWATKRFIVHLCP
jgi:hypothetical protein